MAELRPVERALRILLNLSLRDKVTVNDLFRMFDGSESKRSIQRTLETIQSSNIPLTVEKGPHNEFMYSLHRAFDYIPQPLEPDEMLAAMLLAPFISFFDGTRIGEDIQQVYKKIDHLAPPDSLAFTSALKGLGECFYWYEPGHIQLKPRNDFLVQLMRAVLERRVSHICYTGRAGTEPKEYDIRPYSLLFHTGGIYIIVNIPPFNNYVYLAIQRIQSLSLTDEHFERDPEFSLKTFLENNFGIWNTEPVDIHLRFAKEVALSIEERQWHPSQSTRKLKNGSLDVKMHVGVSEEFVAWILRWGHFVEVLKPNSLREKVRERLESALAHYIRFNTDL